MENIKNVPIWFDNKYKPEQINLRKNIEVEVLIIGAGISGLTTAFLLKDIVKKMAIVEMNSIGSGETGHTTAHITELLDNRYYEIKKDFGKEKAILVAESVKKSMNLIEDIIKKEKIECDFK